MRRRIFAIVFAWIFLAAGFFPASAQNDIVIERLQIDLWPEYDQPNVLVIYHITLASETTLPANVSLRIPARAGAPFNVAFQDVDGMLLNLEYTTQAEGDWLVVSFVALSSTLQMEYYDPNLVVDGEQHSFEYIWPADVRVRNLSINLQQPRSASAMTSTLINKNAQTGADGLQYTVANYGLIDAGQPLTINLSYQKAGNDLSISAAPVTAMQPTGSSAAPIQQSNANNSQNTVLIVAVIAAILLVAGGLFWYTRQQRQTVQASARRRHARRDTLSEVGFDDNGDTVYCSQCGRRAPDGDLFCRTCGNPLK